MWKCLGAGGRSLLSRLQGGIHLNRAALWQKHPRPSAIGILTIAVVVSLAIILLHQMGRLCGAQRRIHSCGCLRRDAAARLGHHPAALLDHAADRDADSWRLCPSRLQHGDVRLLRADGRARAGLAVAAHSLSGGGLFGGGGPMGAGAASAGADGWRERRDFGGGRGLMRCCSASARCPLSARCPRVSFAWCGWRWLGSASSC